MYKFKLRCKSEVSGMSLKWAGVEPPAEPPPLHTPKTQTMFQWQFQIYQIDF